jgi:hypothetical protein
MHRAKASFGSPVETLDDEPGLAGASAADPGRFDALSLQAAASRATTAMTMRCPGRRTDPV